jgi:hypothetical protein
MQENMGKIRHWYEHVPKSGERSVTRSSGSSPAQHVEKLFILLACKLGKIIRTFGI